MTNSPRQPSVLSVAPPAPRVPGDVSVHLDTGHPLAKLARSRCLAVHGLSYGHVGGTACGACWEQAIRDDERPSDLPAIGAEPLPGGRQAHLAHGHPLAAVAQWRCHSTHALPLPRVGGIACGACWEQTIRDDERFAALHRLPRALDVDEDYVDEVAVERACAGVRQRLTPAERAAAVRLLASRHYRAPRIAARLRLPTQQARALLLAEMSRLADRVAADAEPVEFEAAA